MLWYNTLYALPPDGQIVIIKHRGSLVAARFNGVRGCFVPVNRRRIEVPLSNVNWTFRLPGLLSRLFSYDDDKVLDGKS